jgi:hypothetical protein
MKIIFILLLFTLLLLMGCNNYIEEPISDDRWIMPADMWEQMENVFEEVEDELVHFVEYLKENELLDTLERVNIIFNDDEESALQEANRETYPPNVSVYNGEIVNLERFWGSVTIIREDLELIDIIKAIDERGVIARIVVTGGADDASVWFMIKPEHPYIADIRGAQNNFHYIECEPNTHDIEHIKDNWYMQIHPPPG